MKKICKNQAGFYLSLYLLKNSLNYGRIQTPRTSAFNCRGSPNGAPKHVAKTLATSVLENLRIFDIFRIGKILTKRILAFTLRVTDAYFLNYIHFILRRNQGIEVYARLSTSAPSNSDGRRLSKVASRITFNLSPLFGVGETSWTLHLTSAKLQSAKSRLDLHQSNQKLHFLRQG